MEVFWLTKTNKCVASTRETFFLADVLDSTQDVFYNCTFMISFPPVNYMGSYCCLFIAVALLRPQSKLCPSHDWQITINTVNANVIAKRSISLRKEVLP